MNCPKCHTENLADSLFCEECSAPLEASCPSCGAGNRPTAKFCRKCRAEMAGPAPSSPASPQPPLPSPLTYTPKHLADKILTSRSALEGERLLLQTADEEQRALAPMTGVYPLLCAGQLTRAREFVEALVESTRGHPDWGQGRLPSVRPASRRSSLLDRAELARLEGDTAARQRLLEEAKALFTESGAPMRVRQIDALLAE